MALEARSPPFALPLAAGTSLLAPRIIEILYGTEFQRSAVVLGIIIWDVPFRVFNSICGNVSSAVGLERQASRLYSTSTVAGISAYLLLIPSFGLMAAAWVTVGLDGLTTILFFRLLARPMDLRLLGPVVGKMLLAILAMTVVVGLASSLPFTSIVALGGATYIGCGLALGVVDRTVAAALMQRVRPRPAGQETH